MRLPAFATLFALLLTACGTPVGSDAGAEAGVDAPTPPDAAPDALDGASEASCVPCADPRCLGCAGGCCLTFSDAAPPEASLEASAEGGSDARADATDASRDVVSEDPIGCVDTDGDGYGVGPGCRGPDCNDTDRAIHPGAAPRCDGRDNDCSGMPDSLEMGGSLDAYCRSTCTGAFCAGDYPAICRYPTRMTVGYAGTVTAHCQACGRNPSTGEMVCACWNDATEQWICSTRP